MRTLLSLTATIALVTSCAALEPLPAIDPASDNDIAALVILNISRSWRGNTCLHHAESMKALIGGEIWEVKIIGTKQGTSHAVTVKDGWCYDSRKNYPIRWNPSDYAWVNGPIDTSLPRGTRANKVSYPRYPAGKVIVEIPADTE